MDDGARELDFDLHVGEQMFDRLIGTDRLVELLALFRIRDREIDRALRESETLRGGEERAAIKRVFPERHADRGIRDAGLARCRPIDPEQASKRIDAWLTGELHLRRLE